MTACRYLGSVQAYLDGDLPPDEARAFRDHLAGCLDCAAERGAYALVFASLDGAPIWDPGPALTERILDRVLPSRLRRRVVTVVGWCYTALSAVSTYGFVSWIARPASHAWLAARLGEAYLSLVQASLFVVHSLVFSWFRLLDGWGAVGALAERLAPILRALALPLSQPVLAAVLWTAAGVCGLLLWWMCPRRGSAADEVRHVGLFAL
ncbi:MAG TPA: anti-sigma factor [Candidatus Eisenbacteria bacterium]|jgi:hypothetical protein